jgi:trehalose/maltose hydrolase-like predicted phosphorylase
MTWIIEQRGFDRDKIELNGNKFLIGNGYLGCRGTLEEFTKQQLVAFNLNGIYDKVGGAWREPVNAPNGLFTRVTCDGLTLNVLGGDIAEHRQSLDIRHAIHSRRTVFNAPGGNTITVESDRFASLADVHLVVMEYRFTCAQPCRIEVLTGIDADVWDLNGPHLENISFTENSDLIAVRATTHEIGHTIAVAAAMNTNFPGEEHRDRSEPRSPRSIGFDAEAGTIYTLRKFVSVYTGLDPVESAESASALSAHGAGERGYEAVLAEHKAIWDERWTASDVRITDDEDAQLALRYSIYHLLIIAPTHSDKVSIPARGLSAQVYKGAIFWDTEIFMLPFFLHTNPAIARNLIGYRINTLDGARRKAAEYGFRGAFYAWESQETGDDACTHFAFNDVFTGRPMRTYFRDKQVHISADVVYGIRKYVEQTGDESVLVDGGAEVILEVARFFFSWSVFNKDKNRYEIRDVTGPDEYHERVDNNAYTNMLVKYALETALSTLELLETKYPRVHTQLIDRLAYRADIAHIREMNDLLYVPPPDPETLVIPQFDRYQTLEDPTIEELKTRIINAEEYLGGANGIAVMTKILKQADTVLMLSLFKDRYPHAVKKANWEYYEPRTEHGSSLSACIHALVACDIGNPEWGYPFFMKTASIDLTGDAKQYSGGIYLGGTHPAASGGAWMAAVLGFGGAHVTDDAVRIDPHLPPAWGSVEYNITVRGRRYAVRIDRSSVIVSAAADDNDGIRVTVAGHSAVCKAGQDLILKYA